MHSDGKLGSCRRRGQQGAEPRPRSCFLNTGDFTKTVSLLFRKVVRVFGPTSNCVFEILNGLLALHHIRGMWPGQPYQYMQQPQMYQHMQYQSAVPTEVIDWDAVSAIDPDLIRRTGDLTQIQPFISRFVGANLGQYESQVLTHPLAVRLCSILQVSLQYMSDVQRQLDDKVKHLETKLEDKNEEFKKLEILIAISSNSPTANNKI